MGFKERFLFYSTNQLECIDSSSGKEIWNNELKTIPTYHKESMFRILFNNEQVIFVEFDAAYPRSKNLENSYFHVWDHNGKKIWEETIENISFIDSLFFEKYWLIYETFNRKDKSEYLIHFYNIAAKKEIKQIQPYGSIYDFIYIQNNQIITCLSNLFGKFIQCNKLD